MPRHQRPRPAEAGSGKGGFRLVEHIRGEQCDSLSEAIDGAGQCLLGVLIVTESADCSSCGSVERLRSQGVLHGPALVHQQA